MGNSPARGPAQLQPGLQAFLVGLWRAPGVFEAAEAELGTGCLYIRMSGLRLIRHWTLIVGLLGLPLV